MKGPDHISGRAKGIGGHHSPVSIETTWLTPPHILEALGGHESFDLDPCASPPPQPWPTARRMIAAPAQDGLAEVWEGRPRLYADPDRGLDPASLADQSAQLGEALMSAQNYRDPVVLGPPSKLMTGSSGLPFWGDYIMRSEVYHFKEPIKEEPDIWLAEPSPGERRVNATTVAKRRAANRAARKARRKTR